MRFDEDSHPAVAHRGARAFAPENTLPAFAKAAELGCRMVELDVHSSRDGQVVVHHDDDLLRCTDAATVFPGRDSYALADFSLAELKQLDAGRWFAAEWAKPLDERQPFLRSATAAERAAFVSLADGATIRVPLLSEVLAFAARTGLQVNVELKPALRDDPWLAERTLAVIAEAGWLDQVLVSSFDPAQLRRMRGLSRDIAIGLLTDASLPDPVAALDALGADALNPNVADPHCIDDLRAARSAGRMAFPWTCNDGEVMQALLDAGATGVITDYPNRLRMPR